VAYYYTVAEICDHEGWSLPQEEGNFETTIQAAVSNTGPAGRMRPACFDCATCVTIGIPLSVAELLGLCA